MKKDKHNLLTSSLLKLYLSFLGGEFSVYFNVKYIVIWSLVKC
jgi:hypothetical protein